MVREFVHFLSGFPPGFALATVFVNGIPSSASFVNIGVPILPTTTLTGAQTLGDNSFSAGSVTVPVPTLTTLTRAQTLNDGSFQFTFTNSPGALFSVLATTNLTLPFSEWAVLGGAREISPGRFQVTDLQKTNSPQRFYRIRSP